METQNEESEPEKVHSKLSIGVLCFLSLAYLGFGAWVLLDPDGALNSMFLSYLDVENGKFELISNYGGINLAAGLFCLLAICRPGLRALAFVPPMVLNGGYIVGRSLSLLLVGVPGEFVVGAFVFEVIAFSLAFIGFRRL